MSKRCCRCEKTKPLNDFPNRITRKDGKMSYCKVCNNKARKENYHKDHRRTILKKREYYAKNKARINRQRSMPKRKEARAKYRANRRKTDLKYDIECRLRDRLSKALRVKGTCKCAPTLELLGCSVEYLRQHLEKQFSKGMTWKNRVLWHIDHILPCASFDLTNPEEQRRCFHYSNLQPMWAADNLRKGASVEN